MRYLTLLACLVLVNGCSSGIINIPSTEVIDSTGKIITKTAGTIGDVDTYKTHEKYHAWNVAQVEYTKRVQASGFKMKLMKYVVNNVTIIAPSEVSFVEAPTFYAPSEIHDHPVWHTLDKAITTITPWGFGTWAATSIVSSMEAVANRPTNQYNGPVQNTGSYNNAGRDNYIEANGPKMDQGTRTDSPGCSNGNCSEAAEDTPGNSCMSDPSITDEFLAAIPGCSGKESYCAGRCSQKP